MNEHIPQQPYMSEGEQKLEKVLWDKIKAEGIDGSGSLTSWK